MATDENIYHMPLDHQRETLDLQHQKKTSANVALVSHFIPQIASETAQIFIWPKDYTPTGIFTASDS